MDAAIKANNYCINLVVQFCRSVCRIKASCTFSQYVTKHWGRKCYYTSLTRPRIQFVLVLLIPENDFDIKCLNCKSYWHVLVANVLRENLKELCDYFVKLWLLFLKKFKVYYPSNNYGKCCAK